MKRTKFILCAVFCATCAAAASQNQAPAKQVTPTVDNTAPVDTWEGLKSSIREGFRHAKAFTSFSYAKLKPVSVEDGLTKAWFANQLVWLAPTIIKTLKNSSAPLSHGISFPLSAIASNYLADTITDKFGQDMKKNNRDILKLQTFVSVFTPVHATINSVVSTLFEAISGQKNSSIAQPQSENEQLEAAKRELKKATEIAEPEKGDIDINAALEKINRNCDQEQGIKKFAKSLKDFDPQNPDLRTPTLFLYGPTSTGKTEKLKMIAEFARKLQYTTHFIFQSSMMQKQTYVGVASKLLNSYGDDLVTKKKNGEKVMVLLDEAFSAANELASKEGKTGNNNDDFTTFLDKLTQNKIPCLFASNTHLDELQEQERSRVDGGKTWNEGIVAETFYPDQAAIALAFEMALTNTNNYIPCQNRQETAKLIGASLSGCNLGIVYNTFRNIINKHAKKKLVIDIADTKSRDIVVPELAIQLQGAIKGAKSSFDAINDSLNVAEDKKKRRITPLADRLNQYSAQYSELIKCSLPIGKDIKVNLVDTLIKDVFLTSEHLKILVKRINELHNVVNPFKKQEEKKEIEREENNNKLRQLVENLELVQNDCNPSLLVNLFEQYTKETEKPEKYDPSCIDFAANYGIDENKYPLPSDRHNAIIAYAYNLKSNPYKNPQYLTYKNMNTGTRLIKTTAQTIGTIGYNLSYYTSLTNLPAIVSSGLSKVASAGSLVSSGLSRMSTTIMGKNSKQKELDIDAYRFPIDIYSKACSVNHQKALTTLLGNMIHSSSNPRKTWAQAISRITTGGKDNCDPNDLSIEKCKINQIKQKNLNDMLTKFDKKIDMYQFATKLADGGYISKKGDKKW